jgi:hypothetical protein
LEDDIVDHVIWEQSNRGHYRISIVARLKGPNAYNVAYMVRLENPEKQSFDFMLTLDGFKEIGELCIALHDFCKDPIFVNETNSEELKRLLTSENIKNYARISALKRGKKQ